ncbi:hypothetical protein [Aureimonas sp. Leaf454]|uniref:hypothetical protein n=1 Tax=Aureimonas sp. Leaf454 TaxID=1736381 RepID=UPI0006FCF94E|nr:hypothetical protein [Aureimonas sp. Leaf454]
MPKIIVRGPAGEADASSLCKARFRPSERFSFGTGLLRALRRLGCARQRERLPRPAPTHDHCEFDDSDCVDLQRQRRACRSASIDACDRRFSVGHARSTGSTVPKRLPPFKKMCITC